MLAVVPVRAPQTSKEINDALAQLARPPSAYAGLCKIQSLTSEPIGAGAPIGKTTAGKDIMCLRIRTGSGVAPRPVCVFIGGIHGREHAPPDALLSFATALLDSYVTRTVVTYPSVTVQLLATPAVSAITLPRYQLGTVKKRTVSAKQIKKLLDKLDIYIVPIANPDGRDFDLTLTPAKCSSEAARIFPGNAAAAASLEADLLAGWRKNRNAPAGTSGADPSIGVDLNRNFDIIWNYTDYFDMSIYHANWHGEPAGTSLSEDTYRGSAARSEIETKAVSALVDHVAPNFYVDVHQFGRNVLYDWGIENNGATAAMNWRDTATWLSQRDGTKSAPATPSTPKSYDEFLTDAKPAQVRKQIKTIATELHQAIIETGTASAIAESTYLVDQSAWLYAPILGGPNSGCSDDYAFSRQHNPAVTNQGPTFAFTLETGHGREGAFHPDYTDPAAGGKGHYAKIEREIHAALFATMQRAAIHPLK
jgi:murein tripeptide amidase MpaA